MWDLLADLLCSLFQGLSSRPDESNSRVGTSEFERETATYWSKWAVAVGLIVLAAYGLWSLWAGS